jgi:hypothetical protein
MMKIACSAFVWPIPNQKGHQPPYPNLAVSVPLFHPISPSHNFFIKIGSRIAVLLYYNSLMRYCQYSKSKGNNAGEDTQVTIRHFVTD